MIIPADVTDKDLRGILAKVIALEHRWFIETSQRAKVRGKPEMVFDARLEFLACVRSARLAIELVQIGREQQRRERKVKRMMKRIAYK